MKLNLGLVKVQQKYFLDEKDAAHKNLLRNYFDNEVDDTAVTIFICHCCLRNCEKNIVSLQTCKGCKVAIFCTPAHKKQSWKNGRPFCKIMWPLHEEEKTKWSGDSSYDAIMDDFLNKTCAINF